jgi:hypothetical protein
MTRKMMLLIGSLIVALAVVGTGVGLMAVLPHTFKLPEKPPVISAEAYWHMAGEKEQVFIYEDRSVICIEDTGLRVPSSDRPAKRTWKQGTINEQEWAELSDLATGDNFSKLESSYSYEGNPYSDLWFTVEVRDGSIYKSVRVDSYLSPDQRVTYPDMPHPVDDIYARLHNIAQHETKMIAEETIKQ